MCSKLSGNGCLLVADTQALPLKRLNFQLSNGILLMFIAKELNLLQIYETIHVFTAAQNPLENLSATSGHTVTGFHGRLFSRPGCRPGCVSGAPGYLLTMPGCYYIGVRYQRTHRLPRALIFADQVQAQTAFYSKSLSCNDKYTVLKQIMRRI